MKEEDTRVDGESCKRGTGSTASNNNVTPMMTDDEYTERVVAIMRVLHDLKEDVLFDKNMRQPEFDAGHLDAALTILKANVDRDDPRVIAEIERQVNARLLRVLNSTETE